MQRVNKKESRLALHRSTASKIMVRFSDDPTDERDLQLETLAASYSKCQRNQLYPIIPLMIKSLGEEIQSN